MNDLFEHLLRRARLGDADALEELLARHLDPLRAFVRLKSGRLVRERESCSDLVQSICREVLVDISELDCEDESAFRSWLFSVAFNKILHRVEYLNAQKRDAAREVPLEGAPSAADVLRTYGTLATPSRHAEAAEEMARIEAAFDRLPEEDRALILEARLVGRSAREIAHDRGKSEEAVRKALSRARARLGILLRPPA
ncbi:MAG: RNA polymerase sigma factor [Planctomycetota bacterium JB042]